MWRTRGYGMARPLRGCPSLSLHANSIYCTIHVSISSIGLLCRDTLSGTAVLRTWHICITHGPGIAYTGSTIHTKKQRDAPLQHQRAALKPSGKLDPPLVSVQLSLSPPPSQLFHGIETPNGLLLCGRTHTTSRFREEIRQGLWMHYRPGEA